jgi:chemotaxis signal transduction protein
MLLRHTPVAVKVDGIERMQEIHSIQALPEAFKGEERNWYRGLTLIDGQVVPVVRSEAFLTKAEVTLLKAGMQNAQAVRTEAVTA